MSVQETVEFYVKAIDLAKENPTLSNQEKALLNKFNVLLLSGSVEDVDRNMAQFGKVKKSILHRVRELADGIYEDWVRGLKLDEDKRTVIIKSGRKRVDEAERQMIEVLFNESLLIVD